MNSLNNRNHRAWPRWTRMSAPRVLLLTAAIATSTVIVVGCGNRPTILQQDATGPYANAVQIYQTDCITCHGDNLQGSIGPSLQHVGSKMSATAIAHQIDVGGGPMPGYGPDEQQILTNVQIQELTKWLSTKK